MEDNTQKITWVALRHALAKQVPCTEKEAAAFLDSLVHQLTLGLQNEQSVRINNLGTFRLQAVAPRKSVHVGTGESITIAGYNKLAFAPEASVKASMNDATPPKLTPETDPLRKLGEQANEILDILADMGQVPSIPATSEIMPETPEKEEVEKDRFTQEEVVSEIPEEETQTETPMQNEEASVEIEKTEEDTDKNTDEMEDSPTIPEPVAVEPTQKEPTQKRKNSIGLTILFTVVFFILLCIGAYFFLQHKLVAWMESLREKTDNTELIVPQTKEPITEEPATEVTDTTFSQEISVEENTITDEVVRSEYQSFITTEEMHADSRLAWMAYRYWGKKELWVYIYDANRDHITNPNYIKTGTPIRVPRLTQEQQDLNNPDTQRFIEQILNELK